MWTPWGAFVPEGPACQRREGVEVFWILWNQWWEQFLVSRVDNILQRMGGI
jgi:hypothetical protein